MKTLNEKYTENVLKHNRRNRRRRRPLTFRAWIALAVAGVVVVNVAYFILTR
jgi:hypothetical protein